ncbi:phosphopantetheine-binding protein [Megasphaera elsdenii]|uniref:phosphopantetheine-binding protein n=1 Tax=Megasphaera elsdenii TaxID=907 RepID=UPI00242BCB4B|nr:phosphopantetheine-binding protein [Megasphaera elsdenii]
MKNYDEIALRILEDVTETEGLDEDKDLNLFEAGLLDSMAIISMILSIEDELGLKLEPTDFTRDDVKSVKCLAEFLKKRCNK